MWVRTKIKIPVELNILNKMYFPYKCYGFHCYGSITTTQQSNNKICFSLVQIKWQYRPRYRVNFY